MKMFTKWKKHEPGDHILLPNGGYTDAHLQHLVSQGGYDGRVAQRELERRAKERSEK